MPQGSVPAPADLKALLSPRSIAIVGVSVSDPRSWGYRVVRILIEGGFKGSVSVVHPQSTFPGVPTYRSLAEAPRPDLVAICVRAERVLQVIADARHVGAGAAIVFASDFAEAGQDGEQLQAALQEAAGDMPVLGPNCLGFSNRPDAIKMSVAPFLNRPLRPPGPVALIAQSGALGLVLSQCVEEAGIGYSHFVSVGNEGSLTASQVACELIEREEVRFLLLYLEAVRDPAILVAAARRAAALDKRILLLHAGRSEAAQRAALSHTAAIANDSTLLDALCRDAGILRLREDTDVRPAMAMARRGWQLPARPRLAIFTNSGGAGAVLADRLSDIGATVPPLSDSLCAGIRSIGSVGAGDSNPLDIGGGWEALLDRAPATLELLAASPEVDAIVVYYAFGDLNEAAVAGLVDHCGRLSKPCVFVWQAAPPEGLALVTASDVLVTSIGDGVRFVASMMAADPEGAAAESMPVAVTEGPALMMPAIDAAGETIAEHQCAQILRALGVDVVESLAARPDQLETLIAELPRLSADRYVVKANAVDVPHRSRVGLLRVGVGAEQLHETLQQIAQRLDSISKDPDRLLLVQAELAHRAEIAVGGIVDPRFGPAILIGPGGVEIETLTAGRSCLLLDVADEAATVRFIAAAEERLALPAGSLNSVVRAVSALLRSGQVAEVDINPMVVTDRGTLVALDGLIVPGPRDRRGITSTA